MTPSITFVIPAHNAAETLGKTLDSLVKQTRADWSAIVVDDGSTDDTSAIGAVFAAQEPRIQLLQGERGGVCKARNKGMAAAASEWIAFLDADDAVTPDYVAHMMAVALDVDVDLVYCGYSRVLPTGELVANYLDDTFDQKAFEVVAKRCPVAIHCVVTRRQLLVDIGGFDAQLEVCEDWDLWQRVTRTGIKIKMVPEVLAIYNFGEATLSTNSAKMLRDGLTVLRRGHGSDPRVANPDPRFEAGSPASELGPQIVHYAAWLAASEYGAGRDGSSLLANVTTSAIVGVDLPFLALTIANGVLVGARLPQHETVGRYGELKPSLEALAAIFAQKSPLAQFEQALMYWIERHLHASLRCKSVQTLDRTAKISVDLADIKAVESSVRCDLLIVELISDSRVINALMLGLFEGVPPSEIVEGAIRNIGLRRFLKLSHTSWKRRFWHSALLEAVTEVSATVRMSRNAGSLRHLAPRTRLWNVLRRATLRTYCEHVPKSVHTRTQGEASSRVISGNPKHPLASSVRQNAAWNGDHRRKLDRRQSRRLPVLVYHRVAEEAPAALRQWCVTPANFEEQMRLLRSRGFYTVTSDALIDARTSGQPLPGQPVMISFDDAYLDTATTAWPILRSNDFFAEVFVVTDLVGVAALWDASHGAPAPLMDWDTIIRLRREGVQFGSHLATHTPAPHLSSIALMDEALRSRQALAAHLHEDIFSIAAPYGAVDERLEQICRRAGYKIGFSCNRAFTDVLSPGFSQPRVEIHGGWSLEEFAAALGL
jgi:peptidoglycan/xylan/chitin deacetylase (PgdA/CDA1 family)